MVQALNYFLHRDLQYDTLIKGLRIIPMVKTMIIPYRVWKFKPRIHQRSNWRCFYFQKI